MKLFNNSPLISILALDSQAYPLHPKTLYSLFTQSTDAWELFLIADGLSDPIEEITRRTNDQRITIFSGDTSHLFELWNTALQQASGDLISYLSSGIVYYPTHLQTLQKSLMDNEKLMLASAGMDLHPGTIMHRNTQTIFLDYTKEDPFKEYWHQLHATGSFGQLRGKTWEFNNEATKKSSTKATPLQQL